MRIADASALAGPIRARCDGGDRLVEADEPLAGLQRRNGGEVPGPVTIPALLALVRSARLNGIALSRTIRTLDEGSEVSVWASVTPENGGSRIELSQWRAAPAATEPPPLADERSLIRHLAEGYIRIDREQRVLAALMAAPDLQELGEQLELGAGRRWTDFVTIPGSSHAQPLHWRLLDSAAVTVPGSDRTWRVHLLPQASGTAAGFELCMVPEGIAAVPALANAAAPDLTDTYGDLLGRELAPALQQPVNRIIANAETIRTKLAGPLADQYSAYAADIAIAGRHLLDLIQDLADLEAVEAPGFAPAPDRIDLAEVGRKAAGILSVRASDRAIALTLPGAADHAPAIGEFRRVLQILLNLLSNAIRYAGDGTAVTIECSSDGTHSWIAIADRGPGLEPAQAARVFEKFERLGRKGDGGSGLGLYISRRLARAMGGDLTVESEPGQGARFILTLPADPG